MSQEKYEIVRYTKELGEIVIEENEFEFSHHSRVNNEKCEIRGRGLHSNSVMHNVVILAKNNNIKPEDTLFFTLFSETIGVIIDKDNYKEFLENNPWFFNKVLLTKRNIHTET